MSLIIITPNWAAVPDYIFDVSATRQTVMGFGAQVWSGDTNVNAMLSNLNCKYVRMEIGPNWNEVTDPPPTDSSRASFDAYFADHIGAARVNNLAASWAMADSLGIEIIANQFHAPNAWLDGGNQLLSAYHQDFALLWGATAAFLDGHGMRPDYVDLLNEPEGHWNVYVPPADYNTVVKLVRYELDDRGFADVGIVGPGLAYLDHDDGGQTWVNALDQDGVASLAAWSTHAWDESFQPDCGPEFLENRWIDFGNAIANKDPEGFMPVFVTEYMTGATTFNGISYASPGSASSGTASETDAFAVRVFQNTLSLLNCGANALVLWEAADQYWSGSSWGLLRSAAMGNTPRPAYYALSCLLPVIPDNAQVIEKSWTDNEVIAGAFWEGNTLVAAFANGTTGVKQRVAQLANINSARVTQAWAYEGGSVVDRTSSVVMDQDLHQALVSLEPDSTLTVVFSINECSESLNADLNGDCVVNLIDFSIVSSNWLQTNFGPLHVVLEDFESYADDEELLDFGTNDGNGGGWSPGDSTAVLSLSTTEVYSGGQAMRYDYNNSASPYFAKGMQWLAWSAGTNGVDFRPYDILSISFKCTDASGYLQATLVDGWGINKAAILYNNMAVLPEGEWVEWQIDLTAIPDSAKWMVGRVDLFMLDTSGTYGNFGTVYFDDIVLVDSSSLTECDGFQPGDVTGDCEVNVEDLSEMAISWLECALIE
ncbi:MAG: hypothetical protein JW709_10195 [Sedimentisphaerales bacterium]|nr:hypothetical protein [Sedimentisphaerales bacterium]